VRIKRRGFRRVQKVLVPVNKVSFCSSFMSSSVPHEIAAREEAVPVSSPHTLKRSPMRSQRPSDSELELRARSVSLNLVRFVIHS
jgi:hypothetical protein